MRRRLAALAAILAVALVIAAIWIGTSRWELAATALVVALVGVALDPKKED
jgi:hypothetical protein